VDSTAGTVPFSGAALEGSLVFSLATEIVGEGDVILF
jgi:hypothetical protein